MTDQLILAIDIGGTKIAVGAAPVRQFRETGTFAAVVKEPTPEPGMPESVVPRVLRHGLELADKLNGTIAAVGISIGGPLDHHRGIVLNFPHLPGWRNIPLCAEIRTALGAPTFLDNDANLGALAEHRRGAGRMVRNLVYLTVSTGIGGGVILDGRLLHGVGSAAGEVGHITVDTRGPECACGNRGCLEVLASGSAIARRAAEALAAEPPEPSVLREIAEGDPTTPTAEMVHRALRAGDGLARRIWEQTAEYLAVGIGSLIHVLAPEMVILGGGVAEAGEDLLGPLRERLRDHVFYVPLDQVEIVRAALGHDSALIGAATLAEERGRGGR